MQSKFFRTLTLFLVSTTALASSIPDCNDWNIFFKPMCIRFHQIWYEGNTDLYLTGYAWHNRFTYTQSRLKTYNELAWGGGLGKGFFDENGDWHSLFGFAFLDSHKNIEPVLGYSFLKILKLTQTFSIGAGAALFLTARPDINQNMPFPGALPWGSITYRRLTLAFTYIPGSAGAGNVFFIVSRIRL